MVSRTAYREPALTYLQIKKMPPDGEVRTEPSQAAGQAEDRHRIRVGQESEPEVRPIGGGERRDLAVEQREASIYECQRDGAARHAQQQPRVVERPAHEAVGRAEELRHLDLLALREDLQPDGVEGHRDERS